MNKQKLRKAFKKAKNREFTNGMATKPVNIKTNMGEISIIKKINDHNGTFFLIRVKENEELGHIEPNNKEIEANIKYITELRGFDANIVLKSHGYTDKYSYRCILPVKIFKI